MKVPDKCGDFFVFFAKFCNPSETDESVFLFVDKRNSSKRKCLARKIVYGMFSYATFGNLSPYLTCVILEIFIFHYKYPSPSVKRIASEFDFVISRRGSHKQKSPGLISWGTFIFSPHSNSCRWTPHLPFGLCAGNYFHYMNENTRFPALTSTFTSVFSFTPPPIIASASFVSTLWVM